MINSAMRGQPKNKPHRRSPMVMALLAIAVGVVAAAATQGFIWITMALAELLWPGTDGLSKMVDIGGLGPGYRLAVPILGGFIVGGLVYWLPSRRYQGVSDVMEAIAMTGGRMDAKSSIGAVTAATVSLACGASLGREGPSVHFASSFAAFVGERLSIPAAQLSILLGCATAAAVSTAFDAPLAGGLFAMEVVVGYYAMSVFTPVVLATVAAYMCTFFWSSFEAVLPLVLSAHMHPMMLGQYLLLGLLAGIATKVFIFSTQTVVKGFNLTGLPLWLKPAVAGCGLGLVGLWMPEVLGVGEVALQGFLDGRFVLAVALAFFVAKLLVTALSVGGGFCGGVFAPALALGASLGTAFFGVSALVGVDSNMQLAAIVGMASMAAAVLGAPISTIVMAVELTREYNVALPVILGVGASSLVMQYGQHRSFFRWQLASRGVDLRRSREKSILNEQTISPWVVEVKLSLDEPASVAAISQFLYRNDKHFALALDARNRLLWHVDLDRWTAALPDDVAPEDDAIPYLSDDGLLLPSYSLDAAMRVFDRTHALWLPVVDVEGVYIGAISREILWQAVADSFADARQSEHSIN